MPSDLRGSPSCRAAGQPGFSVLRQSNDFYYLSGVESAHAYLLPSGRTRRSTLYLPRRDDGRERGEGKILSVEDSLVRIALTGIEQVRGHERLSQDLVGADLLRPPAIWLPGERLYIRIEDVALVTDDGVENLSGFVPARIADVQRTIGEPGLVQLHKPVPAPVGPGARLR